MCLGAKQFEMSVRFLKNSNNLTERSRVHSLFRGFCSAQCLVGTPGGGVWVALVPWDSIA